MDVLKDVKSWEGAGVLRSRNKIHTQQYICHQRPGDIYSEDPVTGSGGKQALQRDNLPIVHNFGRRTGSSNATLKFNFTPHWTASRN